VFTAQVLVGPSKQVKQTIQTEHNIVKNPNWPEANQLTIYKRVRGFKLGAVSRQLSNVQQMHKLLKSFKNIGFYFIKKQLIKAQIASWSEKIGF